MHIFYKLRILLSAALFLIAITSEAYTQYVQTIKDTQRLKSDSLPAGVTSDWLNSLTDENGKYIIADSNLGGHEDEIEALQKKIFNGFVSGSRFGYSVNSAGDVNGDGYSDVIVGAKNYLSNTGRAYIYYGGLDMNTVPDVVLTGEAINNDFGISVSSAGDVNGDGFSDVIVGANSYLSNTGRAYIFFGGALMNNASDVTMTGEASSNNFGLTVSSAGDVNGDGYSDVIIGASNYSSLIGRTYIFFGGTSMNNTSDVTMTGESSNNFFGSSVSLAGDVNGDGYSDVIVGASGYSSNIGRAYIFFGGASMNNASDVVMTGEAASNFFGSTVSSASDANGDGYSDVIVGAYGYSSSTGKVYIFFGGTQMNNASDVTMTGETIGNFFGFSVSSAGDVNGDGYSDVIVGASSYSSAAGRAYVFFGGANMNNIADISMTGETAGENFGFSVSSAGDVNGDGYADVIVGAYGYSSNTGRACLFDYFMRNEITQDISITGDAYGYFGFSVSSAGDVNGDGYSDVIVGSYSYSTATGRAYIFYGGAFMNSNADVTITGEAELDYFGFCVSSAGDVNGDGYSDVIVGAYGYSSATGRAYIFFGGASMNNAPDVSMNGEATGNYFGSAVSSAGDVNGDGYSDVIVGAYNYSFTGRAYIFFGGASMNNTSDVTMTGGAIGDNFGNSVSSAGDVNSDGYSDVIVGAKNYSSNTGRAYIFLGGATMNNSADVTMTGETTNNNFGFSVSSASDINGDGYSDVIVGANGYTSNRGRAYIFFGGASMNNTADVTMTGEASAVQFGNSVSSAGDINGDGYSDVIVGANGYSSNTGRAYIFYGGTSMNNISDVTMTGGAIDDNFGNSVSSAGDVNGDGYPDVIVGAWGYSLNYGRAYLYTGSAISVKPILIHVKDVPNDQGGQLNLKWARSIYDGNGINSITSYSIFRSFPPTGGNFAWQEIAVITARMLPFYSYTDNTPYDSSSGNSGTLYYRIRANTSDPLTFWYTSILSGRSIDNIAPLMLSPFIATSSSPNVRLNWGRSSASDLLHYVIYRSASININPDIEPVFAITTDSTYLDTSPLSGLYYYFIVAQDIHNNNSPVAVAESPNITLNITMFIEGFYNANLNSQVSDTISVYLRNQNSPFATVDMKKEIISTNGSATIKFGNAPTGNYYIVITHRNSIETWSSNAVSMTKGSLVNYDFSNSSANAFGNNMKQVDLSPLRFAIYSGDVNQDGTIDLTDNQLIDNDTYNYASGYLNQDLNGDNSVDITDAAIGDNNAFNYVGKITP